MGNISISAGSATFTVNPTPIKVQRGVETRDQAIQYINYGFRALANSNEVIFWNSRSKILLMTTWCCAGSASSCDWNKCQHVIYKEGENGNMWALPDPTQAIQSFAAVSNSFSNVASQRSVHNTQNSNILLNKYPASKAPQIIPPHSENMIII